VNLKGIIGQAMADNVMKQRPSDLIEKAKGIAEQFKAFGKSMKDIFEKKEEEENKE
jgi:hypothetical protein